MITNSLGSHIIHKTIQVNINIMIAIGKAYIIYVKKLSFDCG